MGPLLLTFRGQLSSSLTLIVLLQVVPIKHEYLEEQLKPLQELQDDVKRKALTRLRFENLHQHEEITRPDGTFYGNPEGFAMTRYCYYQCCKCQKVLNCHTAILIVIFSCSEILGLQLAIHFDWMKMSRAMRKSVLCHMRTTKAQISLRISLISSFVVRCLDREYL